MDPRYVVSQMNPGEIPPVGNSKKPRVNLGNLLGPEGNVFCVLGRMQEAARRAKWTPERIAAVQTEATQGDYNHVLDTAEKYYKVTMYPEGYRQ
jgi:hypothetical protein